MCGTHIIIYCNISNKKPSHHNTANTYVEIPCFSPFVVLKDHLCYNTTSGASTQDKETLMTKDADKPAEPEENSKEFSTDDKSKDSNVTTAVGSIGIG